MDPANSSSHAFTYEPPVQRLPLDLSAKHDHAGDLRQPQRQLASDTEQSCTNTRRYSDSALDLSLRKPINGLRLSELEDRPSYCITNDDSSFNKWSQYTHAISSRQGFAAAIRQTTLSATEVCQRYNHPALTGCNELAYTNRSYLTQSAECSPSAQNFPVTSQKFEVTCGSRTNTADLTTECSSQYEIVTCVVCNLSFPNTTLYTDHLISHAEIHICQICLREYKQARDYRAHMATHTESSNLQCDICLLVLPNTQLYLYHLKLHGQKGFICCEKCGKYFRDQCTLRIHMRTHTGEKPFKCKRCGKAFRQSGTFKRHKRTHRDNVQD